MKQFANKGLSWHGIGALLSFTTAITFLILGAYWLFILNAIAFLCVVFEKPVRKRIYGDKDNA